NRVGCVGPVSQPAQDARINEDSHYSYRPSLLSAELGTDTPQSRAAPNSLRSHSSWGWTADFLGRNRSRRASTANVSGATPRRRACSFNAASNCGGTLITIAFTPTASFASCSHHLLRYLTTVSLLSKRL